MFFKDMHLSMCFKSFPEQIINILELFKWLCLVISHYKVTFVLNSREFWNIMVNVNSRLEVKLQLIIESKKIESKCWIFMLFSDT